MQTAPPLCFREQYMVPVSQHLEEGDMKPHSGPVFTMTARYHRDLGRQLIDGRCNLCASAFTRKTQNRHVSQRSCTLSRCHHLSPGRTLMDS